jgi:hypothetical protein
MVEEPNEPKVKDNPSKFKSNGTINSKIRVTSTGSRQKQRGRCDSSYYNFIRDSLKRYHSTDRLSAVSPIGAELSHSKRFKTWILSEADLHPRSNSVRAVTTIQQDQSLFSFFSKTN